MMFQVIMVRIYGPQFMIHDNGLGHKKNLVDFYGSQFMIHDHELELGREVGL